MHTLGQSHMSIDQFHRSTSSNIHCNLRWTRWTWDGAGHSHLAHAACTGTPQSGLASWSEMDGKCFLGPKAIDIFPWYWNIMKISTYDYVSFIIIYICVCVCVGVFVSVIIIYSLPMGGAALYWWQQLFPKANLAGRQSSWYGSMQSWQATNV